MRPVAMPTLVYLIIVELAEALFREAASLARYDSALASVKLPEQPRHKRVVLRVVLAGLKLGLELGFVFAFSLAKGIFQEVLGPSLFGCLLL